MNVSAFTPRTLTGSEFADAAVEAARSQAAPSSAALHKLLSGSMWDRAQQLRRDADGYYRRSGIRTTQAMAMPAGPMRDAELTLATSFERRGDNLCKEAAALEVASGREDSIAALLNYEAEQAALLSEIVA